MNIHSYSDNSTLERQMIMNMRTFERNISSQPLQPYLDSRPSSTKYSLLPIVDPRKEINVPLIQRSTYDTTQIFNPGNSSAPWSGYASNVNNESLLRNQVYALQKCSQSVYIPSSKSDLYIHKTPNIYPVEQPFKNLFKEETFSQQQTQQPQQPQQTQQTQTNKKSNSSNIGYALFNNATRCQLKDLTK
jgi:hypothetical protein